MGRAELYFQQREKIDQVTGFSIHTAELTAVFLAGIRKLLYFFEKDPPLSLLEHEIFKLAIRLPASGASKN